MNMNEKRHRRNKYIDRHACVIYRIRNFRTGNLVLPILEYTGIYFISLLLYEPCTWCKHWK